MSTKNAKQNLSSKSVRYSKKWSILDEKYDLKTNEQQAGVWKPRAHNAMYLLPVFVHSRVNSAPQSPNQDVFLYTDNEYEASETKFQFSMKSKIAEDVFSTNADLWFGYTQQSHWQLYNAKNSRPFRATDYLPEVFVTHPIAVDLPFDGQLKVLGAGVMHHSNGEVDPLSRSWNRMYMMAGAEWGDFTIMPRVWTRVSPDEEIEAEDNVDITKFYGYGDVKMHYELDSGPVVSGTFRYNPLSNKGSAELDYIYPLKNNINLYVNFFHGYGESIIDYNHKDTTVGLGVMLQHWKGL